MSDASSSSYVGAAGGVISALGSFNGSQTQSAGADLEAQGNEKTAAATRAYGDAQLQESQFEAEQLRQQSSDAILAGQISKMQVQRQGAFAVSRGLAVAAASGGGAMDPTVVNSLANTTSTAAYNGAVALYNGEEQARVLRMQAQGQEYSGEILQQQAYAKADAYDTVAQVDEMKSSADEVSGITGLLGSGLSLFSKYGLGGASSGGSNNIASGTSGGVSNDIAVEGVNQSAGDFSFDAG